MAWPWLQERERGACLQSVTGQLSRGLQSPAHQISEFQGSVPVVPSVSVSMSLRLTQPGQKCQAFSIPHQELALPKHCMGSVVSEQGFHWDNLVPWGYLLISEEFQLPPLEWHAIGI